MTPSEISYACFESAVALISILGNMLVIVAFIRERDLRTVTNFFVFSLAIVDLLVGAIGIPLFLYSMITILPENFVACLVVNSWIMMLCTVSIFHLLAVSFDRYMAIVWSTNTSGRTKRFHARLLIGAAWFFGSLVGSLPLMGWNMGPPSIPRCDFVEIMDFTYLLFLYYATIIAPTVFMVMFYIRIYFTVSSNAKTKSLLNDGINGQKHKERKLKRQRKVIFSLILVILIFLICWYPLYTMNAITYYCPYCEIAPEYFHFAIILSHMSSAVNPFIYTYTMPGFKDAFRSIICCQFGERLKLLKFRRQSGLSVGGDNMCANLVYCDNHDNNGNYRTRRATTAALSKFFARRTSKRNNNVRTTKWYVVDKLVDEKVLFLPGRRYTN